MGETNREKLMAVMASLKNDPQGKEQFIANPEAYLKSKGLDTDVLSFSKERNPNYDIGEVTDADLAMVAGGGCANAGYYTCYTEGD